MLSLRAHQRAAKNRRKVMRAPRRIVAISVRQATMAAVTRRTEVREKISIKLVAPIKNLRPSLSALYFDFEETDAVKQKWGELTVLEMLWSEWYDVQLL